MPDLWYVLAILIPFAAAVAAAMVVTEAVTEFLVASSLLDVIGLRPWAAGLAIPEDGDYTKVWWYHTALHKLLTCGYCASWWVALAVSLTIPGGYLGLLPWDNLLFKAFLVHRLSNYWHVHYELARRGRVNTVDAEAIVEVKGMSKLADAIGELIEVVRDAREVPGGDGPPGHEPGRESIRPAAGEMPE